jgi:cytochrome bd ubiquinol oxidase subunit I
VDALDLARWQFGITTVYHFLFVPITIGLSVLVAGLQTAWYRTGDLKYKRLTKFWGKLFLVNFAMGVVTGIVQEFQFGMNWSDYSRFVGDVFGAPLAMEGLVAFFLESTFLGLWIFGWDRLSRRVHLATIWLAAIGTIFSAYFILAANSWMQHPVGYTFNEETGRAELTSIWQVLTNSTTLVTFPHTITAAFMTAGAFMTGIAAWFLLRRRHVDLMRTSARLGLVVVLVSGVGVAVTGDIQARVMTEQQPMKMAAAEALYNTESGADFSLLTIGTLDGSEEVFAVKVPALLSFMATGTFDGKVEGIDDLQAAYEKTYGSGDYKPVIPVAYWGFRLMIGFGALAGLLALWGLWLTRRGRAPASRWFTGAALVTIVLPLLANSFGWIFTEMARQPWVVFGVLKTESAVSPGVSTGEVLTTLVVFTLVYLVLAVIEVGLLVRIVQAGPAEEEPEVPAPGSGAGESERPLSFAY